MSKRRTTSTVANTGGAKRTKVSGNGLPEAVSINTTVAGPSTTGDESGIDLLEDAEQPLLAVETQTVSDPAPGIMATSVIDYLWTNDNKMNWLKGILVMEITDEAIRPFVKTEITRFHDNIISNGSLCGSCSSINARKCPSSICNGITSQIKSVHRFSSPCYQNSDITQWLSDPWEIAKCYMSRSKDLEKKPGSDIDFPSVLNVVINNTRFERLITAVDMTNTNNIFCKGRNARNKVMHSKGHQMTEDDLKHHCDIFIDIVNTIETDQAECVGKIKEVRDTPLSITEEDIFKLKVQAARYQGLAEGAIEEWKTIWMEEIKRVTGKCLIPSFIDVCKEALCRLTTEHIKRLKPKCTSKDDWTVEKFLSKTEFLPQQNDLSESYREMLFPSSGSHLELAQWDIYLYCFVLNLELHQPLDNMTLLFMKDAKTLRDKLLANPAGVEKSELSNLCDYLDNPLKDDMLRIFERKSTIADMIHANNVLQSWRRDEDSHNERNEEAIYRRSNAEKDTLFFQVIQSLNTRQSKIEKDIATRKEAVEKLDDFATGEASYETEAELMPHNAIQANIEKLKKMMMSPDQNNCVLDRNGATDYFKNKTGCSIDKCTEGSIILKVLCPSMETVFGFWKGCTDGTVVEAMSKIRDAYREYLGCDTLEFDILLKKKEVTRCKNIIIGDLNSRLERLEKRTANVDDPRSKQGIPVEDQGEMPSMPYITEGEQRVGGEEDYNPFIRIESQTEVSSDEKPIPKLGDMLPVGNVAHGLVFNYFAGFLRNVLPKLIETIQGTTYHTDREHDMLQKFVVVTPASCCVTPIEGEYGDIVIKKMKESLEIKATHGDKCRPYNISVYSICKGNKSFYFTADCPFIIETMYKITKFKNVGPEFLKLQIERFRKTLMELVNHRSNLACNNTVCFVDFEDTSSASGGTLGARLWTAVEKAVAGEKQVDEEFFATITHEDSETDIEIASAICKFLSDKEVEFTNGNGGHMGISILGKAKWNIFVLSKDSHMDPVFRTQLDSAIHESLNNNLILVIPKETDIKDIPEDLNWMTMLVEEDDKSHLNSMWKMMQDTPRTMMESKPSGPVYQGLAYSYMLNYLAIALGGQTAQGRVFRERFEDAVQKYRVMCPCVPRVFLITPESCEFPPPGTQFQNEKHIGEVEPVVIGVRKYCLQLYELTMKNGEKICYAREYTTPAITLHEMAHKYPFAGMKTDDMKVQAREFVILCKEIAEDKDFKTHIGDIKDKCVLVYFNDSETEMPEAVEQEILKIPDTEYIMPSELA